MAGTALEDATPLQPIEALAIIAIFRLILPKVDLKVAGGREYNLRDLQSWMFYAGATSCMVGNYLTTTGRDVNSDLQMIEDLGLNIVNEFPAVVCRETEASQNPSRAQAGG
jgi:biotin synthase